MDYYNTPNSSTRGLALKSHTGEDGAVNPGRKLYRLLGVSLGLLCILQAALNISLRLAFYSSLTEVGCKNMTEEPEDLKRKLINYDSLFQQGWVYFHPSFYYFSSIKKSWHNSRADCLERGADLVIIHSKEEQDFTRKFRKNKWIGLMDTDSNQTWKWVDGTPLTESYWGAMEPNHFKGRIEDCVEIRDQEEENNWNDLPCGDENFWICEKTVVL